MITHPFWCTLGIAGNVIVKKRDAIAASLLAIAAVPWLLTLDWRPMLIGVLTIITSASVLWRWPLARFLLPALWGVSVIIFLIAGLHREGIDIAGRA